MKLALKSVLITIGLVLSFSASALDNLNTLGVSASDHVAKTFAKVMVGGGVIFTTTGDVLIYAVSNECYTANGSTASTLQYVGLNNTTSVAV